MRENLATHDGIETGKLRYDVTDLTFPVSLKCDLSWCVYSVNNYLHIKSYKDTKLFHLMFSKVRKD